EQPPAFRRQHHWVVRHGQAKATEKVARSGTLAFQDDSQCGPGTAKGLSRPEQGPVRPASLGVNGPGRGRVVIQCALNTPGSA
ncbi:hypothetical protein NL526_29510, partial [Klebsiella pneumoniae]|nr:hypothetical protein [Klebsiella pneumoniae]